MNGRTFDQVQADVIVELIAGAHHPTHAPRRCSPAVERRSMSDSDGELVDGARYVAAMATLEGEYVPSPSEWVRDQVDAYERSGGTEANTLLDTGIPVIVVAMRGAKSGKVRKIALMRVEHDGSYALVASKGGAPEHPSWYANLLANPTDVTVQDGPEPFFVTVREIDGDERAEWWTRAAAVYPPYDEYQEKTDRVIPVLLAEPA